MAMNASLLWGAVILVILLVFIVDFWLALRRLEFYGSVEDKRLFRREMKFFILVVAYISIYNIWKYFDSGSLNYLVTVFINLLWAIALLIAVSPRLGLITREQHGLIIYNRQRARLFIIVWASTLFAVLMWLAIMP